MWIFYSIALLFLYVKIFLLKILLRMRFYGIGYSKRQICHIPRIVQMLLLVTVQKPPINDD